MRIDYSDPKKSVSSPQPGQNRPRKESSGVGLFALFITAGISIGIGFGSGWMLSQRSAKKGFKAAMEQQSLENAPRPETTQPPRQSLPTPAAQTTAPQQPATSGTAPQPAATSGVPPANEQPLSFYKTLPSGQKSTALGSGINSRDEKPAKQPLQAAVPGNVSKPAPPPGDDNSQKNATPTATTKPGTRADNGRFAVQVASYSLKSEAETMRATLAAKGFSVGIVESHLGDKGTWYRVRVGKQLDQDAAKELAKKLGKGSIAIPDKE